MDQEPLPEAQEGETAPAETPAFGRRLWMVFIEPERLFRSLAERPVWFWMMAATAVVAGLSTVFIPADAYTEMFREQFQRAGQLAEAQIPEVGTAFRVFGFVAATVSLFLMEVIITGFTFVTFVFLLGDEGSFKQHLAVVAHAGIVPTVGAYFVLPLRISNLDPQLTISVGTLFPFLPDGYLYNVLQSLDLFALWAAVLTGLGISVLSTHRKWSTGASVMIGLTVVFALIVGNFR